MFSWSFRAAFSCFSPPVHTCVEVSQQREQPQVHPFAHLLPESTLAARCSAEATGFTFGVISVTQC